MTISMRELENSFASRCRISRHARRAGIAVCHIAILTVIADVFGQGSTTAAVSGLRGAIDRREQALLCSVDHSVVAAEALKFAQRVFIDQPNDVKSMQFTGRDPTLPVAIRTLQPAQVTVSRDHVDVACGGTFLNFGILIFADDAQGNGTKRLGRNIWFYSDDRVVPTCQDPRPKNEGDL